MLSHSLLMNVGSFVAFDGIVPGGTHPIVCVITSPSLVNEKTGKMRQAWILLRDERPFAALKSGHDSEVCGTCPRRGVGAEKRTCYVSMFNGPGAVWGAYQRGGYPRLNAGEAAAAVAGDSLRISAYGDPAIFPFEFWRRLLQHASGWTGYTHMWRTCDQRYRGLLMASVDSIEEQRDAAALGWRTFRARMPIEPIEPDEITCPASDEAGHKVQCVRCQLCRGQGRPAKSIVIIEHGKHMGRVEQTSYRPLRAQMEAGSVASVPGLTKRNYGRVLTALRKFYIQKGNRRVSSSHADGIARYWLNGTRTREADGGQE